MTQQAMMQLLAVIVGGLIATAGGLYANLFIERERRKREAINLALAFKGEITALLEHVKDRGYVERFSEVLAEIERTRQPFLMPFRIRFRYDRVYDSNVGRIGILKEPLPELLPLFYMRLTSIMEDMSSMGDGTYARLDVDTLLRVYRDVLRVLGDTLRVGDEIVAHVDEIYQKQ
jgi:hypothetical protein